MHRWFAPGHRPVVRRNSTGTGLPSINRYEGGRVTGAFLSPTTVPPDSSGSKTFTFYELDANAKFTPDGDGRYICTVYPNGTLMNGGTLMNAACARAMQWLGASNVAAVVSGTWRSNGSESTSQPLAGISNKTTVPAGSGSSTSNTSKEQWDDKQCLTEMGRISSAFMEQQVPASMKGQTDVQALQMEAQLRAIPQKRLFEGPCSGYRSAAAQLASANDTIARAARATGTGIAEPDQRQLQNGMQKRKLSGSECVAEVTKIHQEVAARGAGASSERNNLEIAYKYQAVPQKLLFEGPCSDHPQASAYLATANKILADAQSKLGVQAVASQRSSQTALSNSECQAAIVKIQTEAASRGAQARTALESAQAQYQYQALPQKQLFEGRCAGHPQAGAFVATANRLIADSERVMGTASVSAQKSNSQVSSAGSRTPDSASDAGGSDDRKVWVGGVTALCIKYEATHRDRDTLSQWFKLMNGCNETVNVWFSDLPGNNYGSMMNLTAGRSDSGWFATTGKYAMSQLNYFACREKEMGQDVHFDKKAMSCFYYRR